VGKVALSGQFATIGCEAARERTFDRSVRNSGPAHASSSAADTLSVPLIGGSAIKQSGADGDPIINADPSWS